MKKNWENKQKEAFAYSLDPKRCFQFSVLTNWVAIFKLHFFFIYILIKTHSILFLKLVLKHALASKRITIMDRKEFIYSYLIIKLPRNYTIKCFKIFRYQYRQYFNPVPVTFLINAIFYILLSKITYIKNK